MAPVHLYYTITFEVVRSFAPFNAVRYKLVAIDVMNKAILQPSPFSAKFLTVELHHKHHYKVVLSTLCELTNLGLVNRIKNKSRSYFCLSTEGINTLNLLAYHIERIANTQYAKAIAKKSNT